MEGSPGYPLCREFSTNRDILEKRGVLFLVELVRTRIERFRRTGVYEDDYIRYFVKGEAHKWAKVVEGRYRLIASLGVVDQIVDSLLFDNMLDAEVKASHDTPIKNGRSFLYNGLDTMFRKCGWNESTIVCYKDVSAWDWHVRAWMYELYYDTTVRLCNNWPQNPNNLYAALMRERLMCLMLAKCMTSDGNLYQQLIPGTMRSGSKITLSMNTRCSVGDKIDGAIMDHGSFLPSDQIIGIGDDTIEEKSIPDELTVKTAAMQGRTLKHVHSAKLYDEGPNRPEWCSKNWKKGPHGRLVWWSVNYEKFCWNLVNLEKDSERQYAAEKLFGGCIEYYWKPELFTKIHAELMNMKEAISWQRSPQWFEYLHTGNESLGKTMKPEEAAELRQGDSWLLRKAEMLTTQMWRPIPQRLECVELNPGPVCNSANWCSVCYGLLEQDCDCFTPSVGMLPIVAGPIAGLATAAGLTYALKDYQVTNENYIAKGLQWLVDHVPQAVKDFPDKLARSEFNKWLHPQEWKYLQAQDREKKRLEEMYKLSQQLKGKPKIARRAAQELGKLIHHLKPVVLDAKAMAVEPNPGPPKGKKGKAKAEVKKVEKAIAHNVLSKVGKGPHTALFERMMGHGHKKKMGGRGRYRNGQEEVFVCRSKLTNLTISNTNNQGDLLLKLQLNPKMLALLVRVLAIEEQLWENFVRIDGAIHVIPSVAYTSVTTLVHYVDKDPTDKTPTGPAAVDSALNHNGKDFALKEGGSCNFHFSGKYFVDGSSDSIQTGADVRQQVPGTYRLMVDVKPGAATTETVAIWATFKVHFKNRQLDTVETPVGGASGCLSVRSANATNIVATDPLGLGCVNTSALFPTYPYTNQVAAGVQLFVGTDGTGTVIGFPQDLRYSGKIFALTLWGTAATSWATTYSAAYNATTVEAAAGAAGTTGVYRRTFLFDGSSGSSYYQVTFTGNAMQHFYEDGTVATRNAGPYNVWHYVRFTGTFTGATASTMSIEIVNNTASTLMRNWQLLGPGTLENKIYREALEQKYEFAHEIENYCAKKFEEAISADDNKHLREKVAFLESMLSVKKDVEKESKATVEESDVELDDWADVVKRRVRPVPLTPTPSLRSNAESKLHGLGLLKK